MFFAKSYLAFIFIIVTLSIIVPTKATICGEFKCDDNAACKAKNLEGSKIELYCSCKEGFVQNIVGNNVNCHKNETSNKVAKCLYVGDKCGPNHVCNGDLKCKEIEVGNVEISKEQLDEMKCEGKEQKCFEKCCGENEMCVKGKCVLKDFLDTMTAKQSAVEALNCPKSQKCQDRCCADNENCSDKNVCIAKETLVSVIEETTANLLPNNSLVTDCLESLKCQSICCKENEKCSRENICVPNDTLDLVIVDVGQSATIAQPSNEVTEENLLTINNMNTKLEVSSTTTFEQPSNEVTEENLLTINYINTKFEVSSTTTASNPIEAAVTPEAVLQNCPSKQKCLDNCCSPLEVCNELNVCINQNLDDLSHLYDFTNEILTINTNKTKHFDTVLPLYDFNNIDQPLECPTGHQQCLNKCCSPQQSCNNSWQCVEEIIDTVCVSGKNCADKAEVSTNKATGAYIMIGLGCLVASLAFGLFKLHNFRRSERNLY